MIKIPILTGLIMKRAWWGGCWPSQLLMSLCLCGTGGVQGSGCWRPWGRRWREVHRPASFLQRAAATTHDVASSPEVSSRPTLEIRAPHVTCNTNNAPFLLYMYISIAARVTFTGRRSLTAPNRGRPSE
jgi:hypothetical protein